MEPFNEAGRRVVGAWKKVKLADTGAVEIGRTCVRRVGNSNSLERVPWKSRKKRRRVGRARGGSVVDERVGGARSSRSSSRTIG